MFNQIKLIILRWGPAVLVMGAIFFASSIPLVFLPTFGAPDTLIRKTGHVIGYFLLTLAFLRGLNHHPKKAVAIALGMVLLLAISDEFHQSFTAGRHPSPVDVLIDMAGASFAAYLAGVKDGLRRVITAGL